jgi:hypothetical protein
MTAHDPFGYDDDYGDAVFEEELRRIGRLRPYKGLDLTMDDLPNDVETFDDATLLRWHSIVLYRELRENFDRYGATDALVAWEADLFVEIDRRGLWARCKTSRK